MLLTEAKNLHMEHLEDELINSGQAGQVAITEYLKGILDLLQGTGTQSKLTVKWDGAPAIICGTNPQNGRFFIGTK